MTDTKHLREIEQLITVREIPPAAYVYRYDLSWKVNPYDDFDLSKPVTKVPVPMYQVEIPKELFMHMYDIYVNHTECQEQHPAVKDAWEQYQVVKKLTS